MMRVTGCPVHYWLVIIPMTMKLGHRGYAHLNIYIDRVIEETVSTVREEEVEGDDGEGIPYDQTPVCHKCRMRFREGEMQKFRRHVSSAHSDE